MFRIGDELAQLLPDAEPSVAFVVCRTLRHERATDRGRHARRDEHLVLGLGRGHGTVSDPPRRDVHTVVVVLERHFARACRSGNRVDQRAQHLDARVVRACLLEQRELEIACISSHHARSRISNSSPAGCAASHAASTSVAGPARDELAEVIRTIVTSEEVSRHTRGSACS